MNECEMLDCPAAIWMKKRVKIRETTWLNNDGLLFLALVVPSPSGCSASGGGHKKETLTHTAVQHYCLFDQPFHSNLYLTVICFFFPYLLFNISHFLLHDQRLLVCLCHLNNLAAATLFHWIRNDHYTHSMNWESTCSNS